MNNIAALVKHSRRLHTYALRHRLSSHLEAQGLCFHASICLARYAQSLGLGEHVRLLRWQLHDDTQYREHWAVLCGQKQVFDLTATQVDGNPNPSRLIDAYPASYGTPRAYPLDVVLSPLESAPEPDERYSERLLWRVHRAMAWFDLRAALRRKASLDAAQELVHLAHTALVLCATHLLDRALKRLLHLLRQQRS